MLDKIFEEKNVAMLVFLILGMGAYCWLGEQSKEVVIPIIAAIGGFVVGKKGE